MLVAWVPLQTGVAADPAGWVAGWPVESLSTGTVLAAAGHQQVGWMLPGCVP